MPGVGYVEMALAASSGRALAAVAFLRPCVLPEPGRGEKCALRCTRRAEVLEIASARGTESSSFTFCFAATLANIESGHAETVSGRVFKARTGRSIEALRTPEVPVATLGSGPRLLEVSSRIGARKSLCRNSKQLLHLSANLANVASNNSKCTKLHLARRQSCRSLRGTVLSRSRALASHAHNNK